MILLVTESELAGTKILRTEKLGMGYIKMRVRDRVTVDGGGSIQAAGRKRELVVLQSCFR